MIAQEFLAHVPRQRGDYLDFYPAAALLHANYISTDLESDRSGKTIEGKLGFNTHETAVMLCQLILPPGESFQINHCPRDSWHNFPVMMFMTAEGYLRLDELEQRRVERNRKRMDYFVSLAVAVLVALLSSYLAHYYASKRLQLERSHHPSATQRSPTVQPSGSAR